MDDKLQVLKTVNLWKSLLLSVYRSPAADFRLGRPTTQIEHFYFSRHKYFPIRNAVEIKYDVQSKICVHKVYTTYTHYVLLQIVQRVELYFFSFHIIFHIFSSFFFFFENEEHNSNVMYFQFTAPPPIVLFVGIHYTIYMYIFIFILLIFKCALTISNHRRRTFFRCSKTAGGLLPQ